MGLTFELVDAVKLSVLANVGEWSSFNQLKARLG